MGHPTTILDFDSDVVSAPRGLRLSWPPRFARRQPEAERDAKSCLMLFLAAALPPGAPESRSLAAMLFGQGAVDAAANRAALDRAARARLERSLFRVLAGSRGRATAGWQRTSSELAQTQRGRVIRRCGEKALHAWLRGVAPAPRLAALLRQRTAN